MMKGIVLHDLDQKRKQVRATLKKNKFFWYSILLNFKCKEIIILHQNTKFVLFLEILFHLLFFKSFSLTSFYFAKQIFFSSKLRFGVYMVWVITKLTIVLSFNNWDSMICSYSPPQCTKVGIRFNLMWGWVR